MPVYTSMVYPPRMSDGEAIRLLRLQVGMTQAELGRTTGIPQGRVSDLESGKRRLSVEVAERMERVFGDGRLLSSATRRQLEPFESRRALPPDDVAEQWTDEYMEQVRDERARALAREARDMGYPF